MLGCKIDEVMQRAALVIVGNAYLAERATRAGAAGALEILPTVIDLRQYCVGTRSQSKPFTIGWIGTPITSPYLHEIEVCLSGRYVWPMLHGL